MIDLRKNSATFGLLALALLTPQATIFAQEKKAQVREALVQALPRMAGDHLTVSLLEVTYPPGGSSSPHSHPCPVLVYVISGAIRSQVKGGPEKIYRAGESFYEVPDGVHAFPRTRARTSRRPFSPASSATTMRR